MTLSPVPGLRLTGLASCAGCAAKMGIGTLHDVLAPLKGIFDQNANQQLLVGLDGAAAAHRHGRGRRGGRALGAAARVVRSTVQNTITRLNPTIDPTNHHQNTPSVTMFGSR